jgi:hypothetical protein
MVGDIVSSVWRLSVCLELDEPDLLACPLAASNLAQCIGENLTAY